MQVWILLKRKKVRRHNNVNGEICIVEMGNSPRIDITNDLKLLLNNNQIQFSEVGILDELSDMELCKVLRTDRDEKSIITKNKDNITCYIKKDEAEKLIKNLINELDPNKYDKIIIACDEEYTSIRERTDNIILPIELIKEYLQINPLKIKNSIVFPTKSQAEFEKLEWEKLLSNPEFLVCNPFSIQNFSVTTELLMKSKPSRVILNCFGFTLEQKRKLEEELNIPVILPRELVTMHIKQY